MSLLFEKLEVYQRAVSIAERVIENHMENQKSFLRSLTERGRLLRCFKRSR